MAYRVDTFDQAADLDRRTGLLFAASIVILAVTLLLFAFGATARPNCAEEADGAGALSSAPCVAGRRLALPVKRHGGRPAGAR